MCNSMVGSPESHISRSKTRMESLQTIHSDPVPASTPTPAQLQKRCKANVGRDGMRHQIYGYSLNWLYMTQGADYDGQGQDGGQGQGQQGKGQQLQMQVTPCTFWLLILCRLPCCSCCIFPCHTSCNPPKLSQHIVSHGMVMHEKRPAARHTALLV